MTIYHCNCAYCGDDLPSSELVRAPVCACCADEQGLYVCIECCEAYEDRCEGGSTEDGWVCHGCIPANCSECGKPLPDGGTWCDDCRSDELRDEAKRKEWR